VIDRVFTATLAFFLAASAAPPSFATTPRSIQTVATADRSLPVDSTPRAVSWKLLGSLDYRKGIVPPELMALQGKRVRVPGFVVPLDDLNSDVKEFLLVPYYGACVHTPPPPSNQMVFVQLAGKTKVALFNAVWIEGTLEIIKVESPYGVVGYRLQGQKVIPYQALP